MDENTLIEDTLSSEPSQEEKDRLQSMKDFYNMLETMSRRDRRKIMKDFPKFSDVINKYSRANNLKKLIEKRNKV